MDRLFQFLGGELADRPHDKALARRGLARGRGSLHDNGETRGVEWAGWVVWVVCCVRVGFAEIGVLWRRGQVSHHASSAAVQAGCTAPRPARTGSAGLG